MQPSPVHAGGARGTALVGTLIGTYAIFDTAVLLVVLVTLMVWFDPLGVFLASVVTIALLNAACCRWLDRNWEVWMAGGHARRLERRLAQLRSSDAMRRPIGWITSGSTVLFALAAAVINPVLVVGAGRAIGGQPIGPRRRRAASLSYAVTASSLYLVVAIAVRRLLP